MLADEHPEHGFVSPLTLKGAHMQFFATVSDPDEAVRQAVAAGGRLTKPVQNQFYGHRSGEITDPFGYRWTLSARSRTCPTASCSDARRSASAPPAPSRASRRAASVNTDWRSAARRRGIA
jgi:hypothetical protein